MINIINNSYATNSRKDLGSMKDIPIIKTFCYKDNYYVYDTFTNRLLFVKKDLFVEINELMGRGIAEYISLKKDTQAYKDVILLIDKGMFKPSFIENIEHPQLKQLPLLIDRLISGITLQVTQKCNFSCRYCVISLDNQFVRNHTDANMSWETAKKSIEFLYKHSKDASSVTIAFYGGEPMLNFGLIKKVTEYCQERFFTKRIRYMMTINGSTLTEEMIRFLSRYDIDIAISLDGPPHIQNKHRKYGTNGADTFDMVYSNISLMRKIDEDYYNEHVKFIPVVFRDENYQEIIDFYKTIGKSEDYIHKLDVSLNGVDYLYSEDLDFSLKEYSGYDINKMDTKFLNIYNSKMEIPNIWHHNGPCIPLERILIDIQGNINMCEKIEFLRIGDIFNGFDLKLLNDYVNIGKISEQECKTCWAMRFCNICVMHCIDLKSHTLSRERKLSNCSRTKLDVLSFFKRSLISNEDKKEKCSTSKTVET